ncbi:MAG TPA: MBL fold metallo-hydrolase [Mobilitalea sp.]|nr:MBL fold metallo-hydrolase [Mobilitalea sp.]
MDNMVENWYDVQKIKDNMYLINEKNMSTMYLIIGKDKALLIDTAMGFGDLYGLVRKLTDLPIILVNTHGHPDHIWGNNQFEEAYLSEKDLQLYLKFYDAQIKAGKGTQILARNNYTLPPEAFSKWVNQPSCKLNFIEDYSTIDLGDLELQVIPLEGHTKGSIMLYDARDKILFSGDAINHHLWMHLEESQPLARYLDGIKKVRAMIPEVKKIYYGHCREAEGSEGALIDHVIKDVTDVIEGRVKGKPFHDNEHGDSLMCEFETWNLWYPVEVYE